MPRRVTLALAFAIAAITTSTGCAANDDATTPVMPMRVALAPRFQVGAQGALPITRIRIVAHPAFVGDGVFVQPDTAGITDVRVDPNASAWRLSVAVPPPVDTGYVVATIELLNVPATGAPTVQWSGQTDPILVVPDRASLVDTVALGRGPLENLAIYDVIISLSRFAPIEGDTVAATASTLPQGYPATVFWASLDTAIATVTPQGSIRTRLPGTARVTATAGFAAETVTLQVAQRPASITLSPDSLVLTANAPTGTFNFTVRDARGAPITTGTSGALTWTSSNPNLVQSLGNGQFSTSGRITGRVAITATAVNAPKVTVGGTVVVR